MPKICFGTSGLGSMPDDLRLCGRRGAGAGDGARRSSTARRHFIDTSRNYGIGRSEERVGAVIRERGGLPKGVVISTKLDRDAETATASTRARARRSLEESLKALGLDRVHLLHLHDPEYAAVPPR